MKKTIEVNLLFVPLNKFICSNLLFSFKYDIFYQNNIVIIMTKTTREKISLYPFSPTSG